jgi:hypothetical protein
MFLLFRILSNMSKPPVANYAAICGFGLTPLQDLDSIPPARTRDAERKSKAGGRKQYHP